MMTVLERLLDAAIKRHLERDHQEWITGQVTAVDTTNFRATVRIGASATATTTVPYMNGGVTSAYVPAVNDYVYLKILQGRSYVLVGKAPLV